MRLQYLPTIRHKYFDTLAHTFVSTCICWRHRVDVALYCNGANAIFTCLPRLVGIPVALNVDGIERKRKKWNRLAAAWYLVSEWLATFCPTVVVTDALHHPGLLPRALRQGERLHSLRRGDWGRSRAARRWTGWGSKPAATSST